MNSKILSFLLLLDNIMIFAHSGRTDSKGGHYNTKTGEYHFHHHSNNNFIFILLLILGIGSLFFLYLISRDPNKSTGKKQYSSQNHQLSKQDKQLEEWRKKSAREYNNKSILGCFVYIIAFCTTMISVVVIPDGNGVFVVFLFILFITFYNPHRKK